VVVSAMVAEVSCAGADELTRRPSSFDDNRSLVVSTHGGWRDAVRALADGADYKPPLHFLALPRLSRTWPAAVDFARHDLAYDELARGTGWTRGVWGRDASLDPREPISR